jgi:hypothetical protein
MFRSGAQPYLPDELAPFGEVIQSVDPSGEEADVVVYVTDLPRRDHTIPIVADISRDHNFGRVSVPGVGAAFLARRRRELIILVIAEVIGQPALVARHAKRLPHG